MDHHLTYYSVLFLFNTMVSLFVVLLAWQRRSVKGAKELVHLMGMAGLWSFLIFFETSVVTVHEKVFFAKLEYVGAVTTPLLYLFFVLSYTKTEVLNSKKNRLLLFIVPAIVLILTWTNDAHKLIWTGFSEIEPKTNTMEFYHGAAFYIGYMGYNYILLGFASVFLFRHILKKTKQSASNAIVILIGGFLPWIASIFYLANLNPFPGLDLVPGSIIMSGGLFAYSILNVKFFDFTPLARETLVENLSDGIVAIDENNCIQDINATAISYLGLIKKEVLGTEITKVETESKKIVDAIAIASGYQVVEVKKQEGLKFIAIFVQPIRNHPGSRLVILRDITDEKITGDRLESSERRYRELAELLPEMICEMKLDGTLTYANQFAFTKFGFDPEDVEAQKINVFDFFDRSELPRVKENLQKVLAGAVNSSNEYIVEKVTGEKFPVLVYSSPIYDNEKAIGVRGVMVDITDRKIQELQIAKSLSQQEIVSRISMIYNSTDDFEVKTHQVLSIIGEHTQVSRVYIFEDDQTGLLTNNTFEWCNDGIGAQIDNLQGISYADIPSWKKMLLEEGIVYSENVSNLPQDLRDILEPQGILSIVVLPLYLKGQFFGFIGFDECEKLRTWTRSEIELLRTVSNMVSDACLHHKINIELVNSVNEISGIINSIPDSIIRISSAGNVISYDSEIHEKLLGKVKRNQHTLLRDVLDEDLANSFMTAVEECLIFGKFKFEFSYAFDGELDCYEARFVKLRDDEVLAIIRNVTESKEQEKQLQIAKIKAEDASRAKSEFLANVSHEIRTPMNAILGFSEWLYDNSKDELHKSYLHTILSSGKNLLALINDILDLSKIESGNMLIQMEPMQCRQVITEIRQVLKQKIDAKNLAFEMNVDRSVPEYIFMDEVRFYQILFNIISNAIKFTEKGYIHVSAYAVTSLLENSIDLTVSIEDTGIGINEDQQENIFKAFTQQSGQSNRHYEGTGLGLSIVSGLLKKLKGEIKLKSKPGKGSTFTLKFREVSVAETSENGTTQAEIARNFKLTECKILIVDDVKFNIQVLKRIISSDDVIYLEANDGQQALDILLAEKPDIIFMDIRMPGMSGYAVTEIIKNTERLSKIPVIAFTASTMNDDMEMIDNVFDAFLQKPVFKKDIMAVLSRFLPDKIAETEKVEVPVEEPVINDNCRKVLPEVVTRLENRFLSEWKRIKDDLIIFDIEDFHRDLTEFGGEFDCPVVGQYCNELDFCLQSFDIESIRMKLNEFPDLIQKLKNLSEG